MKRKSKIPKTGYSEQAYCCVFESQRREREGGRTNIQRDNEQIFLKNQKDIKPQMKKPCKSKQNEYKEKNTQASTS